MMGLGIVTVFMMTFGITALGVGLGAVFPRFKHENVAQIPTGFGGIVYMLVTMLFIGIGHRSRGMARVPHIHWPRPSVAASRDLGMGLHCRFVHLLVLAVNCSGRPFTHENRTETP